MASSPSRRGTSRDANGGSSSANAGKDLKDNFVSRFDNTTTTYAEWRRRVTLYARKLELQGRKSEVALNVLSVLEGPSWTQCEDLDLHELEKESGLDILRQGRNADPLRTVLLQATAQEGSVDPGVHHRVPPDPQTGHETQDRPS